MIVVDTSAVVAIAFNEAESNALSVALTRAERRTMSAANYLECAMVLAAKFASRGELDDWLAQRNIDIVAFDHDLARLAADAFIQFGKGRHPTGLNFGDCFAYALAKSLSAPLLFKGEDFARTDILRAV